MRSGRAVAFCSIALYSIAPLFSQSYPAPTSVFTKIFGGHSGPDLATALAVDPVTGNVAVIGTTGSPDFPVTNAYQPSVPAPPLIAVTQNGWTYPNLGPAVDVLAMAATTDGSIVYASSDSGFFRSADGGVSWTQQLPGLPGANSIAVDGANSNTVYAVISGQLSATNPGVFKSTDGGQTWSPLTNLRYIGYGIVATIECPTQLAGTIYATENGFYRSRDAGVSWISIGPNNNNVFSFALAPSDPAVVYTVSSDGFVYRSANGGDTWTKPGGMFASYVSPGGNSYVYALAVDPQDENTVWAAELNGNLYRSTDGGATFSLVLSDPAEESAVFLSIGPSGRNIILSSRGGTDAHAIVTYDGGESWTRVVTPGAINGVLAGENSFFIETDTGIQGFLTKWSADGSHMIFSTFLSGVPSTVAEDAAGNTYVGGTTLSKFDADGNPAFSQSLGALTATAMILGTDGIYVAASNLNLAGLCGTTPSNGPTIMKFNGSGNLISSTPVPQICGTVSAMAMDASGALYLAGVTFSATLATTPTAIQNTPSTSPDSVYGFLAVLSTQGQMTYLSYLPSAASIAIDASQNVIIAGGVNNPIPFTPTITFTGATCPANNTNEYAYVIKFGLSSAKPLWFTEIAGGCYQPTGASHVAIDTNGSIWVGGTTQSGFFPTLAPFEVQGTDQGFLIQLSADGKVQFSSFAPPHFALGPQRTVYLAGASTMTPKVDTQLSALTPNSVLLKKIDASPSSSTVIDSVGPNVPVITDPEPDQLLAIGPGELVHITGRGLGPIATLTAQINSGRVSTSLGGVQVLFNGVPAPLIGVDSTAIACVTPFELTGPSIGTVQVIINGVASPAVAVGVKPVANPSSVLTVINQNGTFNSPENPAHTGETIIIYATGFGGTNPPVPDGALYQMPLPTPIYTVTSSTQSVTYAGPAPGLVAGIWQINMQLGPAVTSGNIYLTSAYMTQEAVTAIWVAPK